MKIHPPCNFTILPIKKTGKITITFHTTRKRSNDDSSISRLNKYKFLIDYRRLLVFYWDLFIFFFSKLQNYIAIFFLRHISKCQKLMMHRLSMILAIKTSMMMLIFKFYYYSRFRVDTRRLLPPEKKIRVEITKLKKLEIYKKNAPKKQTDHHLLSI